MAQVEGLADGQADAPGSQRKLGFTFVYNAIIQGGGELKPAIFLGSALPTSVVQTP